MREKKTEWECKGFKAVIENASGLIDEAEFRFEDGRILTREFEPSQIAMIEASAEVKIKGKGEIEPFGLNVIDALKIMQLAGEDAVFSRDGEGHKLVIRSDGSEYCLPIIEIRKPDDIMSRSPKEGVSRGVSFKVLNLPEVLKKTNLMASHLTLEADKKQVKAISTGDSGTVAVLLQIEGLKLEKDLEIPQKARYPIEYLAKATKNATRKKIPVAVEFKSNMPCKLAWEQDGAKMTFWLAPRLENI